MVDLPQWVRSGRGRYLSEGGELRITNGLRLRGNLEAVQVIVVSTVDRAQEVAARRVANLETSSKILSDCRSRMGFPIPKSLPLAPVEGRSDVASKELRERLSHVPGGQISEILKYSIEGQDVALIVINWWKDERHAVLYELFVPKGQRGRGVGSAALSAVEELVRVRGRSRVHVIPRPLDNSRTVEQLQGWYERRGYLRIPRDANGMFGKDL